VWSLGQLEQLEQPGLLVEARFLGQLESLESLGLLVEVQLLGQLEFLESLGLLVEVQLLGQLEFLESLEPQEQLESLEQVVEAWLLDHLGQREAELLVEVQLLEERVVLQPGQVCLEC
jgi:hypothetical protein